MQLKGKTNIYIPEQIQADYRSVLMSDLFRQFCLDSRIQLILAAPKHLEMNSILERTWQSLCCIKNSMLVYARIDETATQFALKYATEVFAVVHI